MGIRNKSAKGKAPMAVAVSLTDGIPAEDPLEALLDEQSDEEFGDLILRDARRKRSGETLKLAEWTAQDFSSIYVRFRPHLERHARRFLSNPSQVDEVVQDAFLYLMVSLPELDSEIGVLRFLKWKTRLLAIDVIRASGKAYINSIDDVPEPESLDPEVSSNLEQQDDAAVVKLALSKLNPRHREVLIASMYEEKSTEQIAKQVGLSENATRQLIFRARAAFKKALVGDVDTSGMSAAAILSVAARKAAAEGKKVGAAALTLIALVLMSLTVWPTMTRNSDNIAGPALDPTSPAAQNPASDFSPESTPQPTSSPEPSSSADQDLKDNEAGENNRGEESTSTPTPTPSARDLLNDGNISGVVDSSKKAKVLLKDRLVEASTNNGVNVRFVFNPSSNNVFSGVMAEIEIQESIFTVYPDTFEYVAADDELGQTHHYFFGTMTYIFDEDGRVWSDSDLAKATLRLEVVMEKNSSEVKEVLVSIISKG